MALTKCPVCGGIVSENAITCPHCGEPFKEFNHSTELKSRKEAFRVTAKHEDTGSKFAINTANEKVQKVFLSNHSKFLKLYVKIKQYIGMENIQYIDLQEVIRKELSDAGLSKDELDLIDYDEIIESFLGEDDEEDTRISRQNKQRIMAIIQKARSLKKQELDIKNENLLVNNRLVINEYLQPNGIEKIIKQYINNDLSGKEVIQILQETGLDINEIYKTSDETKTLLTEAIEKDDYEVFNYLLSRGCDANVEVYKIYSNERYCDNPLSKAISKKNLKMIVALLTFGANLNTILNSEKKTNSILEYAAAFSEPEVVSLLLKKGADPNIESGASFTPLHAAFLAHEYDTAKLLIKAGADVNHVFHTQYADYTLLNWSIIKNDMEAFNILMDAKANPNCVRVSYMGNGDNPALADAVHNSRYEMVKKLIQAGADLNCYAYNQGRKTDCMKIALLNYDMEMVEILKTARIEKGYDKS